MSNRRATTPARQKLLVNPLRVKRMAFIILSYLLITLLLIPLIGITLAAIMTNPLWGILFLIYSRWEEANASPVDMSWRALLKFPAFNYWNLLWIIVTIIIVQAFFGFLYFMFAESYRPEFAETIPDDLVHIYDVFTDDWQATIAIIIGGFSSLLAGGYVAGKLPNYKCPSPYRHAIFGSLIFNILMHVFMVPQLLANNIIEIPTVDEVGPIILFNSTFLLFSIAGVWLARRKRIRRVRKKPPQSVTAGVPIMADSSTLREQASRSALTIKNKGKGRKTSNKKQKKQKRATVVSAAKETPIEIATPDLLEDSPITTIRWSRRRSTIISTCVLLVLTGIVGWRFYRSKSAGVRCPNPPQTATLNYWPVSYTTPAELCHDYPSIDAGVVGAANLSESQEEWERGRTAHAGNEIWVVIYINNGAADAAEELHPGRGIARNVRVTTEVDIDPGPLHYIRVQFAGDNTNTVNNNFKIYTPGQERLEVVAQSGEILDSKGSKIIASHLDVGNNTISIGDLPPKWESSIFIRFRLKVVA